MTRLLIQGIPGVEDIAEQLATLRPPVSLNLRGTPNQRIQSFAKSAA